MRTIPVMPLSRDPLSFVSLAMTRHRTFCLELIYIGLAFANGKCSCKSKSHVLSNFKLRPHGIAVVKKSGFRLQSIAGKAPALCLA